MIIIFGAGNSAHVFPCSMLHGLSFNTTSYKLQYYYYFLRQNTRMIKYIFKDVKILYSAY